MPDVRRWKEPCGAPPTNTCDFTFVCLELSPVGCVDDPNCCNAGAFPAAVCQRKCELQYPFDANMSAECAMLCPECK